MTARYRRRRPHGDDGDDGVNIVSLLDVILNLLFFFMVGATFEKSVSSLRVQIPTVSEKGESVRARQDDVVRVQVDADGHLLLEGVPATRAEVVEQLRAAVATGTAKRALVEADANATVQSSITAIDACRQAGITDVMQVVRLKPERAPAP